MIELNVYHRVNIIRQNGIVECDIIEGTWNEEGSGGVSFKPLYEKLNCNMIEIAYGIEKGDTKERSMFLDEEGRFNMNNQVNVLATEMQQRWCALNGRMQLSTIVGDVAVDLGLDKDSLDKVSVQMELIDEKEKENQQKQNFYEGGLEYSRYLENKYE
tara:strand:- start:3579 stop:4052 length:474 start_codon:yes stop_codon:yes gene_type:complete